MEKQYYTPKIEHFNVGFRYERRNHDSTWKKTEFNTNDNLSYFETCLNDGTFRVKSLDHDDIIEAGWEENDTQSSEFLADYILGDYLFDIFDSERGIRINLRHKTIFFGKIANYNKLLDVMEMLEIRNNK